jgi:hypothetical protein
MRSAVVRLVYSPKQVAKDYAILRIESTAENFKRLDIAVCGEGIMGASPPDGGACLPCMKPPGEKPACGKLDGT